MERPRLVTSSGDDVEVVEEEEEEDGEGNETLTPLPKPPAGFVLDPHGRVLMASPKRIATIVSHS